MVLESSSDWLEPLNHSNNQSPDISRRPFFAMRSRLKEHKRSLDSIAPLEFLVWR
jgi:hypothetical protein